MVKCRTKLKVWKEETFSWFIFTKMSSQYSQIISSEVLFILIIFQDYFLVLVVLYCVCNHNTCWLFSALLSDRMKYFINYLPSPARVHNHNPRQSKCKMMSYKSVVNTIFCLLALISIIVLIVSINESYLHILTINIYSPKQHSLYRDVHILFSKPQKKILLFLTL